MEKSLRSILFWDVASCKHTETNRLLGIHSLSAVSQCNFSLSGSPAVSFFLSHIRICFQFAASYAPRSTSALKCSTHRCVCVFCSSSMRSARFPPSSDAVTEAALRRQRRAVQNSISLLQHTGRATLTPFLHKLLKSTSSSRAAPYRVNRSHISPGRGCATDAPPPNASGFDLWLEKLLNLGPRCLDNAVPLDFYNASATFPLGQRWDVDFIVFQISPSCLRYFSPWWEIGGRSSRGIQQSEFPPGLELVASAPFTLRIILSSQQHPAGSVQSDTYLMSVADALVEALQGSSTGHPVLVRPLSPGEKPSGWLSVPAW